MDKINKMPMRFGTVRFFFAIISFCCASQLLAQQECKTNLYLGAALDSFVYKKDTSNRKKDTVAKQPTSIFVDYTGVRSKDYFLRPPSPGYEIISFTVSAEEDEYIISVSCQGNLINSNAERIIYQRTRGTPVYFTCIRVKHSNGKVYTLKDLSVNFPGR